MQRAREVAVRVIVRERKVIWVTRAHIRVLA